jgi:hypothetical protein
MWIRSAPSRRAQRSLRRQVTRSRSSSRKSRCARRVARAARTPSLEIKSIEHAPSVLGNRGLEAELLGLLADLTFLKAKSSEDGDRKPVGPHLAAPRAIPLPVHWVTGQLSEDRIGAASPRQSQSPRRRFRARGRGLRVTKQGASRWRSSPGSGRTRRVAGDTRTTTTSGASRVLARAAAARGPLQGCPARLLRTAGLNLLASTSPTPR